MHNHLKQYTTVKKLSALNLQNVFFFFTFSFSTFLIKEFFSVASGQKKRKTNLKDVKFCVKKSISSGHCNLSE